MARHGRKYVGVDLGGTKILAVMANAAGQVLAREKVPTPRDAKSGDVIRAMRRAIDGVLPGGAPVGIGVAVAGVVDPGSGVVVFAPNVNMSGVRLGATLKKRYDLPVAIGNDVNLGTFGECWFGAARGLDNVVGLFPGTGIGGGIVIDGKLLRGRREFAAEIGHMIMEVGGPQCGCGAKGCLEALASRTAVERDIRTAITKGKKTIIAERLASEKSVIKSGMLRDALADGDAVVTRILRKAAETIGVACLNIRHILDPDAILMGGGMIEACGDFMLPVIETVLEGDTLTSEKPAGPIVLSALGDDAVALGAVALAIEAAGGGRAETSKTMPVYPHVKSADFGRVTIAGEAIERDMIVRVDGSLKKRKKKSARKKHGTSHVIDAEEVRRACLGGPCVLVVGAGHEGQAGLSDDAKEFLARRRIELKCAPSLQAAEIFNRLQARKALFIHVTC